jgi:hypothetical protein
MRKRRHHNRRVDWWLFENRYGSGCERARRVERIRVEMGSGGRRDRGRCCCWHALGKVGERKDPAQRAGLGRRVGVRYLARLGLRGLERL